MIWSALSFLAEPWFVIPGLVVGVLGAGWASFGRRTNTKNRAAIHGLAGAGLGIIVAMAIARVLGFTLWQELWLQYAVGFAFGLAARLRAIPTATGSKLASLAMAVRSELFFVLSLMGGMGAVTTYVAPSVVGMQPHPLTYAFWGFGMLGLLAGWVLTLPTSWLMVKLGWTRGMGGPRAGKPVHGEVGRFVALAAIALWASAALVLPAWLTEAREGRPVRAPSEGIAAGFHEHSHRPLAAMRTALRETLEIAASPATPRAEITRALDAAMRASEVGAKAAPDTTMGAAHREIMHARRALQIGDVDGMRARIEGALAEVEDIDPGARLEIAAPLQDYDGASVLNAQGVHIGEVASIRADRVRVRLGGATDVWGFWDIDPDAIVSLPVDTLVFGPARTIGGSYVVLPTRDTCWREDTDVARRVALAVALLASIRSTGSDRINRRPGDPTATRRSG